MKLQTGLVFSSLLSLAVVSYACANGDTVNNGSSGNGGSNNTGGSSSGNSGGSTGSGNNTGNSGGSTGSGNNNGSGGVHATGGSTGTGNNTGTTGGSTGSSGGSTGGGGASATQCGSTFGVASNGFVTLPAVGGACWSGYAYDGGDASSTIMPGKFSTCGMPCMLTMTGTVGAATAANSYAGTAYLGFNVGQDAGSTTPGTVTPKGSGITVTFTNTSASKIRVQLNADSTGTTFWCADVTTSPAVIPYTSFTQQCYNTPTGPAYAKGAIQSIALSVPGGPAAAAVNITLVSVTENP